MSFQHPDIKRFLLDAIPGRFSQLSTEDFESFMVYLFGLDGYTIESVPKRGDQAANLLARKESLSMVIRILRFPPEHVVKEDEIQKAEAAKAFYETDQAWIIATSSFTKGAIRAAEKADIEWWDWDFLYQVLIDNFFEGKSHLDFSVSQPIPTKLEDPNPDLKLKVKWQPEEGIEAAWYNLSITISNGSSQSIYIHLDMPALIDSKKQQTIADKWADGEFVSGMLYEGASIKTSALFRASRLGERPPGGKVMMTTHIRTDPPVTTHLSGKLKGEACYFITYCYSRQSPQYSMMIQYRDQVLSSTWLGKLFISAYYILSPLVIRLANHFPFIDKFIRAITSRIVTKIESIYRS
ncbi:MAG: restriction endonuclease [Bacteroidota bacterium]|nr:restriction endonuclease [Bacteroidota bacterium]